MSLPPSVVNSVSTGRARITVQPGRNSLQRGQDSRAMHRKSAPALGPAAACGSRQWGGLYHRCRCQQRRCPTAAPVTWLGMRWCATRRCTRGRAWVGRAHRPRGRACPPRPLARGGVAAAARATHPCLQPANTAFCVSPALACVPALGLTRHNAHSAAACPARRAAGAQGGHLWAVGVCWRDRPLPPIWLVHTEQPRVAGGSGGIRRTRGYWWRAPVYGL